MSKQQKQVVEATRAMLARRTEQLESSSDAQFNKWLKAEIRSLKSNLHIFGEVA